MIEITQIIKIIFIIPPIYGYFKKIKDRKKENKTEMLNDINDLKNDINEYLIENTIFNNEKIYIDFKENFKSYTDEENYSIFKIQRKDFNIFKKQISILKSEKNIKERENITLKVIK